jgi:hypothetical protein
MAAPRAARGQRFSLSSVDWRPMAIDLLIGTAVVLFIAAPALFTNDAFSNEYVSHLWLVWHQQEILSERGLPSLFVHSQAMGLFQPFYGFYGATLYTITAALALVVGSADVAFGLVTALSVAAAYGGMLWLGRLIGLPRLLRHVPAIIFVTSAYYVTDLYARSAWPEFVALSMLPLVVAGGIRLLIGPWTASAVSGFAVGVIVLSGSHNISLLWSAILLCCVGGVAWLAVGAQRPPLRRVAALVGLAVLSGAVNAWFLLFDTVNASKTRAGASGFDWGSTSDFNTVDSLLTPLRTTPGQSTTPGLVVAVPVLALVAAIVLYALAQRPAARHRVLGALWWVVGAGFLGTLLLVMSEKAWDILGSPFTHIQFPYRLAGWLAFSVAVLLALSLRFIADFPWRGWLTALLLGLLAITALQSANQLWGPTTRQVLDAHGVHRDVVYANGVDQVPPNWADTGIYRDASLPLVAVPPGRSITIPQPSASAQSVTATVQLPEGAEPIATNIGAGPYAVRVDGANVVGRTAGGYKEEGYLVIAPPDGDGRRVTITVAADIGTAGHVGSVVTILAIVALLALVVGLAIRGHLRRATGDAAVAPA